MKPNPPIYSVDFRDGRFVFPDGSTFPEDGEVLPKEMMDRLNATGGHVACQIEITRRMHPGFDKLLDTEKGRMIIANLIAMWTEEALRIHKH